EPEEELAEAESLATAQGEEAPGDGAETLLELVLAEHDARVALEEGAALPERIDGVVIGRLAALGEGGMPLGTFTGAPADGFPAHGMGGVGGGEGGGGVGLLLEGGDPRRPVVMGKMHTPGAARRPTASADGERLELTADKEIVLRCGKASITLTRAGKIIL